MIFSIRRPCWSRLPSLTSTDSTYNTFKTTNASRTTILLAGANDGMLHAFRESDGEELWAFIPPNLLDQLKNLKTLTGNRDYYVDASQVVADVKTGGTWKTIAIFGERRGGNKYYALDITDTSNPLYLWSFGDTNLGETWSEPAIGKVRMAEIPTNDLPLSEEVSIAPTPITIAESKRARQFSPSICLAGPSYGNTITPPVPPTTGNT